jgi:hypothetical protein
MSITKSKRTGKWAPPRYHDNHARGDLTGRVIFGLLTGDEEPDRCTNSADNIVTSAKDPRR